MVMDKEVLSEPVTDPDTILKLYFHRYSFKVDDQYPIAGYDAQTKINFIKRTELYNDSYEELVNYYGITPSEQETKEIIIQRIHYDQGWNDEDQTRIVLFLTNNSILAHKKKIEKLKAEGFQEKHIKAAILEFCEERQGVVEYKVLQNAVSILSNPKMNRDFKFIYLLENYKSTFSQTHIKENYIASNQNPMDYLKYMNSIWGDFQKQYAQIMNISLIYWLLNRQKGHCQVYESVQSLRKDYANLIGGELDEQTAIEILGEQKITLEYEEDDNIKRESIQKMMEYHQTTRKEYLQLASIVKEKFLQESDIEIFPFLCVIHFKGDLNAIEKYLTDDY